MRTEAGRRTVLDLFLRDVVCREEFQNWLRIFSELELFVESLSESAKLLKLSGVVIEYFLPNSRALLPSCRLCNWPSCKQKFI